MFDRIKIKDEILDVYFDIENFKLKVNIKECFDYVPFIEENYVKIDNYILFLKNSWNYNNYSFEYDVLFYIYYDFPNFSLNNLNRIVFYSEAISYLLYTKKEKTLINYFIEKDNCEFNLILNRTNKIQKWFYNQIRTGGSIEINITKCSDWNTYGNIINSIINSVYISLLTRRKNNFDIFILSKKGNNCGYIKFPQENHFTQDFYSLGNIEIIKNDFVKIISSLIDMPFFSQYIIPQYSNNHNQLDFYKLYACFENEYKLIKKEDLYNSQKKKQLKLCQKMKEEILKTLNEQNIKITDHYKNALNNYNPEEGHKQKLINAIEYSKKFISQRYNDINFIEEQKKFIDYIYKTRIKIIHEPSDDIEIKNSNYVDIFNEIVFALFLKRCGISNNRVEKICKEILIPYA